MTLVETLSSLANLASWRFNKSHVTSILAKLDAADRTEAVALAISSLARFNPRGSTRAFACRFRRPRRKPGLNLRAAPTPIPTQTVNPAAGQRGRSPEHAEARVVPTTSNPGLTTTFSYTPPELPKRLSCFYC